MKKVLITGAGGFIGSNMVKFLLNNTDYIIYGIDNFKNGKSNKDFIENLISDRFIFYDSDFTNFNFINKNIEIVFHFAANPSVEYSVKEPLETNENNLTKTLELLKLCTKHNVKKFIFSSTCAVYGDTKIFPTKESDPIEVKSPYAVQKYCIEQYLKIWSELYGMDTISLRYFNVYGPNQYATNAYANVICAWMRGFVENTEIRLDDSGLQSRSFVYVEDVCMANYIVAKSPLKFNGDVFNVSNEKTYTLLDIKKLMKEITGGNPKINNAPKRKGDIFKTEAYTGKLKKYGFSPKYGIEEGIRKTYEWYKTIIKVPENQL